MLLPPGTVSDSGIIKFRFGIRIDGSCYRLSWTEIWTLKSAINGTVVGRPPDPTWKRPPGRPRTNSAAITTMFPLRVYGGKPLVAVTRERRYGPSRLRVNDDDVDQVRALTVDL